MFESIRALNLASPGPSKTKADRRRFSNFKYGHIKIDLRRQPKDSDGHRQSLAIAGYICVRGFDVERRTPKPLSTRLHAGTSVKKK